MYFENSKEENAREELQRIVNHEYSEFVNRDRKEVVDFESIRTEAMDGFESSQFRTNQRAMDIVFGNHFDEYAQERVHYIAKELWDGNYSKGQAELIIPVLREVHNKNRCDDCKNGHPLRIPSMETIEEKRQ